MKLSTKGRYGLRAITDIAVYGEEETVSLQSIAKRQQISERYLEQLVASLKKAGLVTSIRGAQGGYKLAKQAAEISVGDILRALEGSLEAVACADNQNEGSCIGAERCVTRLVWKQINDSIRNAVDTLMLSQLVEESKKVQQKGQSSISICESQE